MFFFFSVLLLYVRQIPIVIRNQETRKKMASIGHQQNTRKSQTDYAGKTPPKEGRNDGVETADSSADVVGMWVKSVPKKDARTAFVGLEAAVVHEGADNIRRTTNMFNRTPQQRELLKQDKKLQNAENEEKDGSPRGGHHRRGTGSWGSARRAAGRLSRVLTGEKRLPSFWGATKNELEGHIEKLSMGFRFVTKAEKDAARACCASAGEAVSAYAPLARQDSILGEDVAEAEERSQVRDRIETLNSLLSRPVGLPPPPPPELDIMKAVDSIVPVTWMAKISTADRGGAKNVIKTIPPEELSSVRDHIRAACREGRMVPSSAYFTALSYTGKGGAIKTVADELKKYHERPGKEAAEALRASCRSYMKKKEKNVKPEDRETNTKYAAVKFLFERATDVVNVS